MKLLLVSLAVVLMGGEAYEDLRHPPPARLYYVMPSPQHVQRVRAAHQAMRFRAQTSPLLGMSDRRPTRLVPKRGTTFVSFQGPTTDNEHSGLDQTRRQSDKPSTVNQANIGENRNPSLFNQDPKPSGFKQRRRFTGFVLGFKTPSFESDNNPSRSEEENDSSLFSQDFKPASSEDERKKPSSSDADRKHSGFEQHANKPFDKENKTSLVETQPSHPGRNPECYMQPDPGTCRAAFPRYYYDHKTGTCNCFLYGGCREDGQEESLGSYFTLEACQKECRPPKKEEGPICKEIFKEDQFISFLEPPSHNTQHPAHLGDDDFLASLL